jgi:hypothetical protein
MTNEQLRMQMLAGVITESEYAAVTNKQIEEADRESLNESMIGGIVGIGAINQIPATPKTDYEMAFDHFLGERYEIKPNRERDDIKDVNEDETSDMEAKVKDEVSMNEEDDQNNDGSSEITEVTNDWMKLIKTISDLIIKQKTADFPDKMKLHKQINAYGNQKVALETQLIDALAGLNQNAGLEGNNETIKSLLTQRSYNNEGKEVEEPNNY